MRKKLRALRVVSNALCKVHNNFFIWLIEGGNKYKILSSS